VQFKKSHSSYFGMEERPVSEKSNEIVLNELTNEMEMKSC
jgi:hypothetical protein